MTKLHRRIETGHTDKQTDRQWSTMHDAGNTDWNIIRIV